MAKRDYYEVLGVSRDASQAEIKKAYRRLAMKHHPDRNEGDAGSEDLFKEAKEAYEVLSDDRKRAAYDQFGHAGVDGSAGAGPGPGGFGAGFGGAGNFSDIFDSVFGDMFGAGRGRTRGQPGRGADLRYDLELSLEDAVFGTSVKIRVPTYVQCRTCGGSGGRDGSRPVTCSTCGGHGQVRMQQGFFSVQQTCPRCQGHGQIISDPCDACNGSGRVRDQKTLSVKVPAGVDVGDRIRLAGEGEAGQGGAPAGDLYVQIHIREHPIFTREGDDLYCDMPISFVTAALGGELEVPTLGGRVKLKVPEGTQVGKVFRMRGKGVKSVRSGRVGDLYCRVVIETPVHLSRRQKELLREFEETVQKDSAKHSPEATSWLDKVKHFFEELRP